MSSDICDDDTDTDRYAALQPIVERLDCGYVIMNEHHRIIVANAAALSMMAPSAGSANDCYREPGHILRAIANLGNGSTKPGALIWVATSRIRGVTVALDHIPDFTHDRTNIVLLLDLDKFAVPNPTTLKLLFGLTVAEARLASYLAQGKTPNEIARTLHLSRTTIRSQLAAVFSKTNTKRQSALVALLGRIAVLP
jgi:DNA-binding CsgD family transcriptional regulator